MTRPSLQDLNAFTMVAEHRSFRKAADVLGVSRSSLSHAIASLEQNVGARLLHRTTRSVALTEAGQRMLERLKPALHELDLAIDEVAEHGGHLGGTLRINGGEDAIAYLLEHVVPTFVARHPRVSLDLVTDGKLIDIVEHGFDAGLRLAQSVPQDMVAIPLSPELRFLAVASPSYVKQHGRPMTPDDLHAHRCIRQRFPSGKLFRWEFGKGGRDVAVDVPGTVIMDNPRLMIAAAAMGLGIAYVAETVAQPWLDTKRLLPLLEDWSPPEAGLHLYYSGHRQVPPALRALVAVVKEKGPGKKTGRARPVTPAAPRSRRHLRRSSD